MVRILKALLVMALAAVLVVGLTTNVGCDSCDTNGGIPNGDAPNGDEPNGNPNGDEPNGDEPDGDQTAEPDLTSGLGLIIDSDEYGGLGLQAGDLAPDFRFEDASGQTFSLSDFRGKPVVLNFWTTNCPYCHAELGNIQQIYAQWQERGMVILTLNLGEGHDTVADYLQSNGFSFSVVLDREAKVAAQYRIASIPRTFYIDRDGLIRGIQFGSSQSADALESLLEQLIVL